MQLYILAVIRCSESSAGISQACNVRDDRQVHDIVIVGGGPAGLFAGLRLLNTTYSGEKIVVLEATNRIGGRLYSEQLPGIDFDMAELGGMLYIHGYEAQSHPYMTKLVAELGIDHKPFDMDEDNQNRPYLLRDFFVKQKDLRNASRVAYRLNELEQNQTPREVYEGIFNAIIPEASRNKTPYDMETIDGDRLINYGQINTYNLANASDDAHNYLRDTSGYSESYANQNAAIALPHYNDTIQYSTPRNGMAAIPKELAKHFERLNGKIEMNRTVTRIDECHVCGRRAFEIITYNYATDETKSYFAYKVILALTRTQLKRIHWPRDTLWRSKKRHLLDSGISFEATKIFLAFKEPWWRKDSLQHLNLTKGRTVSSLPSRQTYYYTAKNPQVSNRSFVMLFNDGPFAKFWKALASPKFKNFTTSSSAVFPMTEPLVKEAVRELAINHNTTLDVIGWPYFGWIMVWDPDETPGYVEGYGPYIPSEGWVKWAPGVDYRNVTEEVMKLDDDLDIYICGSVFSLDQGWANGALVHADRMLNIHFDVPYYMDARTREAHLEHLRKRRSSPLP
jgi:phytoene dehydrogenase-like protein